MRASAPPSDRGMATLLLADGSPTIQRIIALTFAGQEFKVLSVNDGDEAITAIVAERPDIVLADVAVPKRNGYEVAAFVKQRPDLAHIPVLLLAGALERVDEARAVGSRCDGVLVKPFEPQQLLARVRELVRGGKGRPMQAIPGVPRPIERLIESRRHAVVPPRTDEAPPRLAADTPDEEAEPLNLPTLRSVLGESALDPVGAFDPFEALVTVDRQARREQSARVKADAPPAAAPAMNEALIEAVAARVIEKLAPGADLVRQVVTDVAERLVREEIERIRGRK
jgi:DNA-binding response OmpR family regulator